MAALPGEARCYAGRRVRAGEVVTLAHSGAVTVAGVGAGRAAAAAAALLAGGSGALVSWGTAAGLDPRFRAGDLVLPTEIRGPDGVHFAVDRGWHAALASALHSRTARVGGTLVEVAEVLARGQDKRALHASSGALAADMESAATAAAARAAGVPFIAVRAVLDASDTDLPRCALAALDGAGALRAGWLARELLRRPVELSRLARVALDYRAARRALTRVVALAGPRLGCP